MSDLIPAVEEKLAELHKRFAFSEVEFEPSSRM